MTKNSILKKSLFAACLACLPLSMVTAKQYLDVPHGKVQLAPAYLHVDVVESKKTTKKMDMPALRGEASFFFGDGWLLRPSALYGKNHRDSFLNLGVAFGKRVPLNEQLAVIPLVGVSYSSLNYTRDLHTVTNLNEKPEKRKKFDADYVSPYVGLELIYQINPDLRICGQAQYAWSYLKAKDIFKKNSVARGPGFGLMLEYDIDECWSINVGGAYYQTLTKDDDGFCVRGVQLGLSRWF